MNFEDIEAVIFDMDGTMVDNMGYHKQAWIAFAKKHGINLSEYDFQHKFSGKKNKDIFESLFNKSLTLEEITSFTKEKEGLYRKIYSSYIKEVEGLSELIQEIKAKGLPVAIATTAPKENREFVLKHLNMEDTFDSILGDEDTKKGKPDPEIYLKTAEKLGIDPKNCLVFEDTPPGVLSAKNAGMKVVGVLTTHTKEELKADSSIKNFSDLK